MKQQELIRFVGRAGQRFRLLLPSASGAWLICYEHPTAPFFVNEAELVWFERIVTPDDFMKCRDTSRCSTAYCERLDIIQPLLEEEQCICNKELRKNKAAEAACSHHTTARRVLRLYYRYLATGTLLSARTQRKPEKNVVYDWAIRTYYYSSKRLSLRAAYEMMLIEKYTDKEGNLCEGAPGWSGFQHYFYRHAYHKRPEKLIAREGLSNYQRNHRKLSGTVSEWRSEIGCFQMDATQADLYLVSRLDRSSVIGRPNIYLAVDTATRLIAGIYIGMEAGEGAVMACLANAAEDKVAFCARYGIAITQAQWPCHDVPEEMVTDQGREFTGERMNEFCTRYGAELHILPPFRPDRKGIVEKTFDLLQGHYKPMLRGKGVIEPDAQERWATDYRSQAILDLDEFTAVVLHCVIYLNSGRCLQDGKTPAQKWLQSEKKLLSADPAEIYRMGLQRTTATMTRRGIRYNRMYYVPQDKDLLAVGDRCTIAYDERDVGQIYIVSSSAYHLCKLTGTMQGSICRAELDKEKSRGDDAKKEAKGQQIAAEVKLACELKRLIEDADRRRQEGDRP